MQAIILAGGFGTRLQSVVKDVPKPMADIASAPFLSYLLRYLKQFGVTDVVLSIGYLHEKISEYFGKKYCGININYALENQPLGTGGAIINSLQFIDKNKPCLVLNGDSFLQVDLQKFFDFHAKKKSRLSLVLRQMNDCSRYGRVLLDNDLMVKNFEEKKSDVGSGLINGGIYLLDPKIFDQFQLSEKFSFEQDFLMKNLVSLEPQGFISDDYFIDIGIPEDYARSQQEIPQLFPAKNKALFLDRDGVINVDYGHVFQREKFHFNDEIFEICQRAKQLGYLLIVVTNQAGIAKGFYSEEEFLDLTKWMENEFEQRGVKITKTFYCPYHVEAKVEKYRRDSIDRKPAPGMLLKAIAEFEIDAKKSMMIGDNETDIQAAEAAKIGQKLLIKKVTDLQKAKEIL